MRSHLKKFGLPLLFLGVLLLTGPLEVRAASGCCQIVEDRATESYSYATLEESACTERNTDVNVLPHTFEIGRIANADESGCMDDLGGSLPKNTNPLDNPKLSVSIPNLNLTPITCNDGGCSVNWLADYINALYKYGLGIIGILAVIAMMIGGILWVTAAGNDERIGDAKKWIGGSIMGVIIALTAYTMLNIVNPALIKLSPIKLASVQRVELSQVIPPEEIEPVSSSVPTGTGAGKYKVPILYQGSYGQNLPSTGCGPTSLTMVLNFYQINKSVPTIAQDASNNGDYSFSSGWTGGMGGFERIAKANNLKSKSNGSGSSIEDAISLLQYGPVIISYKHVDIKTCVCVYPRGNAHYVVLTGYENGYLLVNDPNSGNHHRSYSPRKDDPNKTTIDTARLEIGMVKKCCLINMGSIAIYK